MTKYLSKDGIEQIMDVMQHVFMEGRNKDAPELSMINDSAIPSQWDYHAATAHFWAERAHSTAIMKNTHLGACLDVRPFAASSFIKPSSEEHNDKMGHTDLYMS